MIAAALAVHVAIADLVRFDTVGEKRPLIRIYHEGNENPLKVCVGGCSVDLPHGKYRVALAHVEGTYAYDDGFTVRGPTRVTLHPGNKPGRQGLAALGWTLFGLAIPVAMFGFIGVNGKGYPAIAATGGVMFVGGIVTLAASASMKPWISAREL